MLAAPETGGLKSWRNRLSKACLAENHEDVRRLLEDGRHRADINHNNSYEAALRSAVQACVSKGKTSSTHLLLTEYDAAQYLSQRQFEITLQQAVERKHQDDLVQLLDCGGTELIESSATFARHLLLMAALNGDTRSLQILSTSGVDIHAEDSDGRTLLIHLAAEKSLTKNTAEVLRWFVKREASLVKKDNAERNVLHWAAVTGKVELTKAVLEFHPDIEAPSSRGRTALHLAAARESPQSSEIVELLLKAGADPTKESDGGWTALHNASQIGDVAIVQRLLDANANVNAALTSGVTPLHWAATKGHEAVAKRLLAVEDIRRHQEDIWGSTPMLRAAQNGRASIVKLLAPEHDAKHLPPAQRKACECRSFRATVTDFKYKEVRRGHWKLQSLVNKEPVYKILYNPDFSVRLQQPTSTPTSRQNFRWIHFPANNMAWAKTLFHKIFVEEQTEDVDAFKALQKSLTQRHRGPQVHSTFMLPNCMHIRSNKKEHSFVSTSTPEMRGPAGPTIIERLETPSLDEARRSPGRGGRNHRHGSASMRGGVRNASSRMTSESVATLASEDDTSATFTENGARRKPGNIALFMPYLHFEHHDQRLQMSETIKRFSSEADISPSTEAAENAPDDEILIQAYLNSSLSLHPRRTLDQFLYHGFDTKDRDVDQVVYRYCRDNGLPLKIFMVDQLWLWIFGKDLVVTCFPQRWGQIQHRNDPLNVLDGVIEDINSKTRPPVSSVADLAILIFSRCLGSFDRHRPNDLNYHFMDMFESSIGRLSVTEPMLFKRFESAASDAADWLREQDHPKARPVKVARNEAKLKFVDELLEIKEETKLLKELKDIRDELNIIKSIFEHQQSVLKDFERAMMEQQGESFPPEESVGLGLNSELSTTASGIRNYGFREQEQLIKLHLRDVERMDRQAITIFESLTQLLDFKQMHANAIEARFAREQASLTAKQGETIMVFTIVTIFFLPMSFVAAFFTINIAQFSNEPGGRMSLSYVSKFVFGIGLTISVILITVAFLVNDVRDQIRKLFYRGPEHPSRKLVDQYADSHNIVATSPDLEESKAAIVAGTYLREGEMRTSFEPSTPIRILSGLSNSAFSAMTGRSGTMSWRRGKIGRRNAGPSNV